VAPGPSISSASLSGVSSNAQDVKHSDCMLCDVEHSERILARSQWTSKDSVPNVVGCESAQRVTQLCIIVGVSYLYNDDIQGWNGHGSLSLSLAVSVAARVDEMRMLGVRRLDRVADQNFGSQPDSDESDQGFLTACPLLIHPLLSATTKTTATVTTKATPSSATPTYCMEVPDTPPTPHTNESSPHHHRNERKPTGQPRNPRNRKDNSKHSKDSPRSSDAPKLDTTGGRATPSTPRSCSPDSKANDSSTPQPHRKSKPKPKPSGSSDIKDSGHKPASKKAPPNKPDSKQRRTQEKHDGGTTDASESKSLRRAKKTVPDHKEPTVDSEPIHDSADTKPPSLKQGPPRQKRQGKFDGKLTTGDAEPHREQRHTNPDREKYRVDHTSDDLTTRLTRDLRTSPYLDCAICFNPIRPLQPTWSCSPNAPIVPTEGSQQAQYCWITLHLKCARSWATKSVADVRQAYIARGEDKPGEWLCTGCRAKRTIEPSPYRYIVGWASPDQY